MRVRLLIPAQAMFETYVDIPNGVDIEDYIMTTELTDEMEENAQLNHVSEFYFDDWEIVD